METKLEEILTNSYKEEMITYLATHPEDFEEAVMLALAEKQPYSWRAAWLLWSFIGKNDPRILPYVKQMVDILPFRNDDQQREIIKILYQMELDEKLEGILFDHCVSVWEKINKKPSVRFNAFKVIVKIAGRHPDLAGEIKYLVQDQYLDSLSAAARKSILKMIVL